MARSLAELEEARAVEAKAASRWLKRNPGLGSLPPKPHKRSDTGESLARESVLRDYSPSVLRMGVTRVLVEDPELLSEWENRAEKDPTARFEPLMRSPQLTEDEQERRERMEHVMSFLLPDHVNLLHMRYVERLTLDAIAKECGVTRPAVVQRLNTAKQDFRRAYGQHYADIELREETE